MRRLHDLSPDLTPPSAPVWVTAAIIVAIVMYAIRTRRKRVRSPSTGSLALQPQAMQIVSTPPIPAEESVAPAPPAPQTHQKKGGVRAKRHMIKL